MLEAVGSMPLLACGFDLASVRIIAPRPTFEPDPLVRTGPVVLPEQPGTMPEDARQEI
jgi:hypothetical protein